MIDRVPLPQPSSNGDTYGWLCRCDCGKEVVRTRKALLGEIQSCGCYRVEKTRETLAEKVGRYDRTTVSAIRPARGPNKNNKSGVMGVYWNKAGKCWVAKITVKRKRITLGRFHNLEDAAKARKDAEGKYFVPIIAAYEEQKDKSITG